MSEISKCIAINSTVLNIREHLSSCRAHQMISTNVFFTRYLSPGSNHMEYRTRFWQLHSVTSICFVELVFCCWILRQMDAKLHSLKLTRTLPPIRIWCVRSQIKIEMIRFAGHSFCHVLTNPSVPLAYRWNNGFSRSLAKSSIFFRVGLECLECVIIHNRSGK